MRGCRDLAKISSTDRKFRICDFSISQVLNLRWLGVSSASSVGVAMTEAAKLALILGLV
jgi:hypothetical protein